jgi:putative ABC transport system permease protein
MTLTEEHIDYIIKDVRYRGIVYNELDDELIDHICSLVETKMSKGVRFINAYDQVIMSFGATKGIQKIQTQTISINNNNPRLMIKNYLKMAVRNLQKHKFYSFINIIGLSIGITCCMLITLFIIDELNYDQHHEKADRIHRVTMESVYGGNHFNMAVTPAPMASALISDYPEVEMATRFRSSGTWLIKKADGDQNIIEQLVVFADSTLFDVFTIPFIEGNPTTALTKKNSLVVSQSAAAKYFGDESALNKTLILDNEQTYTITGVYKDMPQNGHFNYDVIITMLNRESSNDVQWTSNNFHTYVLLHPGSDPEAFKAKLPEMIDKYVGPQVMQFLGKTLDELINSGTWIKYHLQSLTDIHLYSQLDVELSPNGDIKYIYIFSIIALFLLVIACINFMNLSTARSANRAKEVGVRKVLGSFRSHLIKQFLTESILLTIFSFIIAFVLAYLAMPLFNNLSGKALMIPFDSLYFWIICLSATIIIGLLSGTYPAFFLSSFKPVSVLKGKIAVGTKSGIIRSLLVVFQFSISIILVVGTFTIFKQLNYIQSKKLGFDKEQILLIENFWALGDQVDAFKNQVSSLASISSVSASGYLPITSSWRSDNGFWIEGESRNETSVSMQYWRVDHDYISTLGMEVINGRDFSRDFPSDSSGVIINKRAAKLFGFENPLGERIVTGNRDGEDIVHTIIGVVDNFHFQSMKENIDALCMILGDSRGFAMLKTNSNDIGNTVSQIEQQWKSMAPGQPFVYSFLDEEFNDMYQSEQQVSIIFTTFAMLAVFIACMGLFALAAFTAEQRTKEIGVRKVLGASVKSIVYLLSKEFIKLISISFVIAAPLAWWGISTWLESYTYKTTIGIEIYLIAGLLAFLVAWLTMSYQSIKAALSNPVESLRSE